MYLSLNFCGAGSVIGSEPASGSNGPEFESHESHNNFWKRYNAIHLLHIYLATPNKESALFIIDTNSYRYRIVVICCAYEIGPCHNNDLKY